jgi:hypothetical protein
MHARLSFGLVEINSPQISSPPIVSFEGDTDALRMGFCCKARESPKIIVMLA